VLTFWEVVTAFATYASVPGLFGLWTFQRLRSRSRNRRGVCAVCATPWSPRSSGERYLIHGRLVCEACGVRARRRMPWHLGVLAAATAIGTGVALAAADVALHALLPPASVLLVTAGALRWMKGANRRARRRIARSVLAVSDPGGGP